MALADLISLTQPQVLRLAVDDLYRGVTAEKLGRYALILFGIAVVAGVFKYWMRQAVIGISRHVEYDLRNDLFAHLERLPIAYFQRERTGDLMSRTTNDLAAVRMMLGPGIMYLVNTVVTALVSLGFMLAISPRLTALALLPLPFVSLTVWYFGDRIHRPLRGDPGALLARSRPTPRRTWRACAWCAPSRARTASSRTSRALNRGYLERNLQLIRTSGLFYPMLAFLSGLAALLVLYLGGREVVAGAHHARPVRGLHRLHRHAELADGGAGLGDQHVPARHRVVGAHRRGARPPPAAVAAAAAARRPPAGAARGEVEFRAPRLHLPGRGRGRPCAT